MRHGAMVPWDYDLDIALIEEDWNKLNRILGAPVPVRKRCCKL